MAFAAIGDLHLGWLSSFVKDGDKLQLDNCKNTFKAIKAMQLRDVVLLGDIFHTCSPDRDLQIKFIEMLLSSGLRFTLFPGNHDMANSEEHSLWLLNWLQEMQMAKVDVVLTPAYKTIGNVNCWLVPHPFRDPSVKKVSWCLGHFPWTGAQYDNGRVAKGPNNPKGRWLLGDFHKYQQGDRYTYAGSLSQVGWQETLPKGFLLVDSEDAHFQQIETTYKLSMAQVDKPEKLKSLDKDTLWTVTTKNMAEMPSNWQALYPHIVRLIATSSGKALLQSKRLLEIDPLKKADDYLDRKGEGKTIARAKLIGRQILSTVS